MAAFEKNQEMSIFYLETAYQMLSKTKTQLLFYILQDLKKAVKIELETSS